MVEIKIVNQRIEDINTKFLALASEVWKTEVGNGASSRDVKAEMHDQFY